MSKLCSFQKGKTRYAEAKEALLEMKRAIVKPKVVALVTDKSGQRWVITETPFRQRLVWFLYILSLWISSTIIWIVVPVILTIHIVRWLLSF